jgi:hypothetical protein
MVEEGGAVIRLATVHPQIEPKVVNPRRHLIVRVNHDSIVMDLQGASAQRLFFWGEDERALLEQKPEDDPAPNQDHYQ